MAGPPVRFPRRLHGRAAPRALVPPLGTLLRPHHTTRDKAVRPVSSPGHSARPERLLAPEQPCPTTRSPLCTPRSGPHKHQHRPRTHMHREKTAESPRTASSESRRIRRPPGKEPVDFSAGFRPRVPTLPSGCGSGQFHPPRLFHLEAPVPTKAVKPPIESGLPFVQTSRSALTEPAPCLLRTCRQAGTELSGQEANQVQPITSSIRNQSP